MYAILHLDGFWVVTAFAFGIPHGFKQLCLKLSHWSSRSFIMQIKDSVKWQIDHQELHLFIIASQNRQQVSKMSFHFNFEKLIFKWLAKENERSLIYEVINSFLACSDDALLVVCCDIRRLMRQSDLKPDLHYLHSIRNICEKSIDG